MRDLSKLALIYSHEGYWRADGKGFAADISRSGIYDRSVAEALVKGCVPEKGAQLCPVAADHPVIMAEELEELRAKLEEAKRERGEALRQSVQDLQLAVLIGSERDALRAALRQAIINMGGIAEPGVSDAFLIEGAPAEAKALKESKDHWHKQAVARSVELEGKQLINGRLADDFAKVRDERDELLKSNAALREALETVDRELRVIAQSKEEEIRNDLSSGESLGWWRAHEHASAIITPTRSTPAPEALERVKREAQAEALFQLKQDLGMFANGDGDMKRDQLERYLNEKSAELRGQR